LDVAARGFSFQKDGPLDMRMNPDAGQSVASWLAEVDESELARVLKHDGEERFAKRIAHALVQARDNAPITTTRRCAEIIREAHPAWPKHHDPATKSFQAMRIFINQELVVLPAFLQGAKSVLREGGRLCVISFHSLEDRIVKRFVQDEMKDDVPQGVPMLQSELDARKGVHMKTAGRNKAVKASEEELQRNPRARSARLRIMEKVNAR
jgi:16S rRNA (cytosine1402-N4)-methyltransferase